MDKNSNLKILLADDDKDDIYLFREALSEIPINAQLNTVQDGEQLMKYLYDHYQDLPDIIFLDLNMPIKNGFECLTEIQIDDKLKELPVIMFSTSYPRDMHYEEDIINLLYKIGAHDYIRKPSEFNQLKAVIKTALDKAGTRIQKNRTLNRS